MLRLVGRKLGLLLVMLPLLNVLGYFYAIINPGLLASYSMYMNVRAGELVAEAHYWDYLREVLAGNLGEVGTTSVNEIFAEAVPNSLVLLGAALLLTTIFGPLLGALAISRHTRRMTPLGLFITTAGASMPGFFLGVGLIAMLVYSTLYGLRIPLPLSGYGLDEHLLLPVLVLASRPTFQVARVTASLLEHELHQDYLRVAQSKGLSWPALFRRHLLPNIVAPVIVTIGQSMRLLIAGLIIVEALFLWPGVGRILMQTIAIRVDGRAPLSFFANPPLLAALAVIFGLWLLLTDLVTSVLAYLSDPRLRMGVGEARHR